MKRTILALALAASAGAFSAAHAADAAKWANGMLTDASGRTLYTFDKDAKGKSNCNGGCAAAWPPAMATAEDKSAGEFSIVTRDDGGKQWTYKGMPLYRFASDQKAGDATGDNSGGVWHVIRAGKASAAPAQDSGYSYGKTSY